MDALMGDVVLLSTQDHDHITAMNVSTYLAEVRTYMAAQRTHLAWARTSIAMLGLTIVFNKLLVNKEASRPQLTKALTAVGYSGAVGAGVFGLYDYIDQVHSISDYDFKPDLLGHIVMSLLILIIITLTIAIHREPDARRNNNRSIDIGNGDSASQDGLMEYMVANDMMD